jgi:muramoyltetrapeptide carboxypeptidase
MTRLITFLLLLFSVATLARKPPPLLQKNSTIGVIATGFMVHKKSLNKINEVENLAFTVVKSKTLYSQHGYFSGTKEQRLSELHKFISDPAVDAIFNFRGGFGNAQLLEEIDYDLISKHPKVIMGYSDVTALLIAIYTKTGLITYHGPMPKTGISKREENYIQKLFIKGKKITYQNDKEHPIQTITKGTASGILIGGNLSVITSLLGSEYLPDWTGKVLFIEDVGEEVYKIDRMLTQLKLAGVLDKVNGVIVGQFTATTRKATGSPTLEKVLIDHLKPLGVPVYMNAQIGHISDQFILPVGGNITMDATMGRLILNKNK